ncbi:hypothetical protein [Streptomyces pinistramenti]|uniref:hypothetical protein n=1 Tax=Streptomyces pinistramenti TaxID=2884812 RepID=UPI001D09322F|nr:hypothetical protein [Streptomyces pinistramenti]MCB5910342.1 hypothetical protein [Streptomyces pinistramenti]
MAPSDLVFRTLTNTDRGFYTLMGPLFGSRAVHKSLGGPAFDDDGKTWIVAVDGHRRAAGFVGVTRTGAVESLYTAPGNNDLRAELVAAAVTAAGDRPLHATVTHSRAAAYRAAGFETVSETTNFTKLTRHPQESS